MKLTPEQHLIPTVQTYQPIYQKIPRLIHQTIRQRYIRSFLDDGHYFTPCSKFSDKVEFRYGYCLFDFHLTSAKGLQRCVQRTRSIPEVNQWIDSTGVSCWVRNIKDESRMWKVHGWNGPAIRISMDADAFVQRIKSQTNEIAHGDVTYGGRPSHVRPQFLGCWQLGEASDAIHHLFFHKRLKYTWEDEFRVVLFSNQGRSIKMNPELIDSVEISPLGNLDPALGSELREVFGDRLIESEADRKTLESRSNKIDETVTSDKLRPMFEELGRLETHSTLIGKGWNDPKSSEPIEPIIKVTREIRELKKAILAEQAATKGDALAPEGV